MIFNRETRELTRMGTAGKAFALLFFDCDADTDTDPRPKIAVGIAIAIGIEF